MFDGILTVEKARSLSARFGAESLWLEIETLADRVWNDAENPWYWHHLIMAVGNFKRQGGTVIRFPQDFATPQLTATPDRPKAILFPYKSIQIHRDDRDSWQDFSKTLSGLGVPTSTTILSALWPGQHAILDIRVFPVAIALVGLSSNWQDELTEFLQDRVSPDRPLPSIGQLRGWMGWYTYEWYRARLLEQVSSATSLIQLERALFLADDLREGNQSSSIYASVRGEKGTWRDYSVRLREHLSNQEQST